MGQNSREVEARLLPLIYDELRRIARACLRKERGNHTLQPTAVVHEAYLRLAGRLDIDWRDREHFFSVAARTMRRVLVDYARMRNSNKRSGAHGGVAPAYAAWMAASHLDDLLTLDECLERLSALDSRQARVVEMRFFAGLEVEEVAGLMDISPATVKREWRSAKAWLRREMRESGTIAAG